MAKTKLDDIKPSEYTRQEDAARKLAEEELKKGNEQKAVEAKRQQLIANQLAKEAIEIINRYDKATNPKGKFQKFLQTDKQLQNKSQKRNVRTYSIFC